MLLVLPSRQECWGLVINEGAAFGIPIVSTLGSGAALEFLSDKYSRYLAKRADADDLAAKISALYEATPKMIDDYSQYLKQKSYGYSQEKMVQVHMNLISSFTAR